jgi:hypothetical protein
MPLRYQDLSEIVFAQHFHFSVSSMSSIITNLSSLSFSWDLIYAIRSALSSDIDKRLHALPIDPTSFSVSGETSF